MIDPSIISGIKQFRPNIPDPIDQYGKSLTLKALMRQDEQAQKSMASAERLKQMYAESGNNPEVLKVNLLKMGMVNEAKSLDEYMQSQAAKTSQSAYGQTLPEGERQMFGADPKAFIKGKIESGVRKPNMQVIETPKGQIAVDLNDPNSVKKWGPKPREDKTLVAVIGPDGQTPVLVPRSQAQGMTPIASKTASKPTEQEAKAAFYAQNMKAASATLDALESAGFDLTKFGSQAGTVLAGGMTNIFASPEAQQAKQAQNQWAEQMLRMQTGAAATQPEIDRTVKTYFPTVGDDKATVDLKRSMRLQAEGGVFEASGRAKDRVPQPAGVGGFDAEKEARYQAWKAQQGK